MVEPPKIAGFARVRVGDKLRFVKVTREKNGFLVGHHVGKDGSRVVSKTKDGELAHELIVARASDVVDRWVMNTKYAELEMEKADDT